MADLLVVKAKIKDVVPGFNISSDFADALDAKVKELVKEAAKRAEGNSRKTVMAKDLKGPSPFYFMFDPYSGRKRPDA